MLSLTLGLLLLAAPGARSDDGGEILDRGPVHEAFANAVVYNPEPGPLVTKTPPGPIEELPPETKPEGANVVWIPGYWAWDDERDDYIWVSGIWRDIPPGRVWVPGYWLTAEGGARWVAGYWGDAGKARSQVEYIPEAPPASLEVGPNIPAPSDEAIWVSGFWLWQGHRYVWSPGCWHTVRTDYVWVPASYNWTPHGFIFVGGYWDYVVARRGVVYAPVYFRVGYPFHPGWSYRPRSIVSISVFSEPIFYRPRYAHYYFGDYYAPAYNNIGFQISFSFHSRGGGYDPLYARQCWENRHNPGWERHYRTSYEQQRTRAASRPAPVFRAQEPRPDTRSERNNPAQSSTMWQNRTAQATGSSGNPGKDKSPSNRPPQYEAAKQGGPGRIEHQNTDTPDSRNGSRSHNPVVTDTLAKKPQPAVENSPDQRAPKQPESSVINPQSGNGTRRGENPNPDSHTPRTGSRSQNPVLTDNLPANLQPAVENNRDQRPPQQPESSVIDREHANGTRRREIPSPETPIPHSGSSTTNPVRLETFPARPQSATENNRDQRSTKQPERSITSPQPAVSHPVQTPRSQPESTRRQIQPQTPVPENRNGDGNRQTTSPRIATSQPQVNHSATTVARTLFPNLQRERSAQPQNTQQNPPRYVPNRGPSFVPQQNPSTPSRQNPRSQDTGESSKKSRDENP